MTRGDPLEVRYENRCVGTLRVDETGRFRFTYSPTWLDAPDGFAISVSLSRQADEFSGPAAHNFFANLLPEGNVRQAVCNRLGISLDNDYALLKRIGGECAGALSIVEQGTSPVDPEEYRYERIDDDWLQQRVLEELDDVSAELHDAYGESPILQTLPKRIRKRAKRLGDAL